VYTPLHDGWTVHATAGPVPEHVRGVRAAAAVPGCVTTDLMVAGLVPDPYLDENEQLLAWIGRTDWSFETNFETAACTEGDRVDLVFEGLDTVATVKLNGMVLAHTANMHRSYRLDARAALRGGTNTLQVSFKAPVDAAEQMAQRLGPRPHAGSHPYNAIRKMACNYGWDWGPDLPTVGIWRPVGLDRWKVARIRSVRPLVRVDLPGAGVAPATAAAGGGAEVPWADASSARNADSVSEVHVEIERAGADERSLVLTASVAGRSTTVQVAPGESTALLEVAVPGAELWWPVGYGPQPLYDLEVRLDAAGGEAGDGEAGDGQPGDGEAGDGHLGSWHCRTGFRSVELDTSPEERGARFGFVVNGRAISVRGANWIPDDCFVSRVGRDRYRRRLVDARDANVNLIRIWGGGTYGADELYDLADELGLLVWQDFMLACAAYAEEEPLASELVAEAKEAVERLCRHPSLAAWSGGNENIWGHDDWGWQPALGELTWGAGYYFDLFPAIVSDLDPGRVYMAGSPWSPSPGVHPNDPDYGSVHVWDVWNQKDYLSYREHRPKFVAEFGFQGPPTWPTLARAISQRPLTTTCAGILAHQKAGDGMAKLERSLVAHFPEPASFEDWHWATSLNQARAVGFGVEHWRCLEDRCRGMIVWQLNDCWPVVSWAAIDGDGRLKPVWYELRRVYAERLLSVQPALTGSPGALVAVAVNDSATTWQADLQISRQDFFGQVLAETTTAVRAEPGRSVAVAVGAELSAPGNPASEMLVVSDGDRRALWFFAQDKDIALPVPSVATRVERTGDGYDVVIEARSLQRDIAVLAERACPSATSDDMIFTLLAGETKTVHVRSAELASPEALVSPSILRSANQLYHAS